MKDPARRDEFPQERSTLEIVLEGAQQEQEWGQAGHSVLAASFADVVGGRNRGATLANQREPADVMFLTFMERCAPPVLAQIARDRLDAGVDQSHTLHQLPEILKQQRGASQPANPLKRLLRFGDGT